MFISGALSRVIARQRVPATKSEDSRNNRNSRRCVNSGLIGHKLLVALIQDLSAHGGAGHVDKEEGSADNLQPLSRVSESEEERRKLSGQAGGATTGEPRHLQYLQRS